MAKTNSVSTKIDDETERRLEELAYERSEPGDQVGKSELVREAIVEKLDSEGIETRNQSAETEASA